MYINYFSSILIGYLFGCISTGYLVCKFTKNIDIREHGSGNAGMTNVIRVLGWRMGMLTLLGDFSKGVFAIFLTKYLFGIYDDISIIIVMTAMGVILGHNWPVFLGFRGGKGVASTFGLLATMNLWVALIAAAIIISIIIATRYVSLASMITALVTPILFLLLDKNQPYLIFSLILTVMTIYRHKDNIKRLLAGTESKIGAKKTI